MEWFLFILALLGITLLHELTHLLVAQRFGYRPLAWGFVVGGVFVIFDDTLKMDWSRRYWNLQLAVPWIVTSLTLPLAWWTGFAAAGLSWTTAGRLAISPGFLLGSLLVSASGSVGDLMLALVLPRKAATEPDLTLWDMRLHQSLGAWPFFTRHGHQALERHYGRPAREVWQEAKKLPRISLIRALRRQR